jgi:hypothetical protein
MPRSIIPFAAASAEIARVQGVAASRDKYGDDADIVLFAISNPQNSLTLSAGYLPEAGVEVGGEHRTRITRYPGSANTDVQFLGGINTVMTLRGVWHGAQATGDVVRRIDNWLKAAIQRGGVHRLVWGKAWDKDVVITSYRPRVHADAYIEYDIDLEVLASREADAFVEVMAISNVNTSVGVAAAVLRARIAGSGLVRTIRDRFPLSLTPQSAVVALQPAINRESLGRPPVFAPVVN